MDDTNNVYLLEGSSLYEASDTLGIYTSLAKAQEAALSYSGLPTLEWENTLGERPCEGDDWAACRDTGNDSFDLFYIIKFKLNE